MAEAAENDYTLERFEPLVGKTFTIEDSGPERGVSLQAVLIEARSLRDVQGAGSRSRQFSLVWRGPKGTPLPQRIYTVHHPALGALLLFLVPLGPDVEGMRYEAVFT